MRLLCALPALRLRCTVTPILDAGAAHSVPDTDMTSYKERVERVESEATTLLAKVHKLEEQRQLLEFKNRVLTEMVCETLAKRSTARANPQEASHARLLACCRSLQFHSWTHRSPWPS